MSYEDEYLLRAGAEQAKRRASLLGVEEKVSSQELLSENWVFGLFIQSF